MTQLPVLMIVFNRPEPTREVIAALRSLRPSRLYIAADGPRAGREDDVRNCAEVRQLTEMIDWPCDLQTRFQDENLGCGPGVAQAISWFFENEAAGAIIEDDCVPHPDFLTYCAWALEKFRDDRRVWHIGGNNFGAPAKIFGDASAGFTSLAQVWGWATWRDRWADYQYDPSDLLEATETLWRDWQLPASAAELKMADLKRTAERRNTWDYQWQVTVLNHQGLALVPACNLISNVGDGSDATHTPEDDRCRLPISSASFQRADWDRSVPEPVAVNAELQAYFIEKMHLLPRSRGQGPKLLRPLRRLLRRGLGFIG